MIGRQLENDVVILDESASRRHAEIVCHQGEVTIRDLGSMNGTFVNHTRIAEPVVLKNGDQIRIGLYVLTLAQNHHNDLGSPTEAQQLGTKPLTRDFLLESIEQNAVFTYEAANRLTSILDLKEVIEEISNYLKVALGVDKCLVILADQFENLSKLGFSESFARQALEKQSVVVVPDVSALDSVSDSAQVLNIRSVLCIPVINEEKIVALAYAYKTQGNTRPFDYCDIQLAVAISHQAGLAIQRSQLLEKARLLEEWALTDSLTNLKNRRHIMKLLEIEFARARRFHHPLTVLMMDIDDFKQVNDRYGHIAGDQVLIEVARRLRTQIRSIDIIGRYGGDEFVVLIIEAGLKEALTVADRLKHCVAEHPVDTEDGPIPVTLSIGVTPLKDTVSDAVELLKEADEALRAAKTRGKNQVTTQTQN